VAVSNQEEESLGMDEHDAGGTGSYSSKISAQDDGDKGVVLSLQESSLSQPPTMSCSSDHFVLLRFFSSFSLRQANQ
jgi:hypothetical protein